jgi:hypothetical protein
MSLAKLKFLVMSQIPGTKGTKEKAEALIAFA